MTSNQRSYNDYYYKQILLKIIDLLNLSACYSRKILNSTLRFNFDTRFARQFESKKLCSIDVECAHESISRIKMY